ncbi:hypothetical protein Tco_0333469 [Tanacetum coccineum]
MMELWERLAWCMKIPKQNPNVVTVILPPATLNTSYEVRVSGQGKGSFDVIIGMYWFGISPSSQSIVMREVRIPLKPNGEILEVQGEKPEKDLGSLACIKADEKKL